VFRRHDAVCGDMVFSMYGSRSSMSRQKREERMDEFARKYLETHDKEIARELSRLARELEKLEETSSDKFGPCLVRQAR
jgi:hypothetical protein